MTNRHRGLTLIDPIIWLVVAGILAAAGVLAVTAFLDRAADERARTQLEQLAAVTITQTERDRARRIQLEHFTTRELVETAGPVYGTEARDAVSVAVGVDGLDAVAALVSDSGHCVVLTLRREGAHTIAVRDDLDTSAGQCEAGALLP